MGEKGEGSGGDGGGKWGEWGRELGMWYPLSTASDVITSSNLTWSSCNVNGFNVLNNLLAGNT